MTDSTSRPRLVTPAFVALSASELAYFTGIGALIPLVPLYVGDRLGGGPGAVGLAVGSFSVAALLLRPWAGRAVDRWGQRRLLVLGATLFATVVLLHIVAVTYWALVGLRVALGLAESVFFVAGMAALADLAPAERLGEALSYNSLSLYLGIAFGPGIGELLLSAGDFELAWAGVAALGVTAALLGTLVPRSQPRDPLGEPAQLLPRHLLLPGLAFVAGLAGSAAFLGFAALYARDIGMSGAAPALLTYGGVVVVCRILFARHTDRIPAERLSGLALGLVALGLGLVSLLRVPAGLLLGAAVLGLGVTFLTPAFFRILMERLPVGQRGLAAATFSIMVDVGLGGGPIVYGAVAGALSIPLAFAVAGVVAALAVVMVGRPRRGGAVTAALG